MNRIKPLKLDNCEMIPTPIVPKIIANILVLIKPANIFVADAIDILDIAVTIFLICFSPF